MNNDKFYSELLSNYEIALNTLIPMIGYIARILKQENYCSFTVLWILYILSDIQCTINIKGKK